MGGGVAVQVDGVSVQVAQERCNLEFRDRAGPTGPFTLGIQVIVSSVWVLLEVLWDGQELGVRVAVVTLPSLGLGHCRPRTETQGCCHSSDRVGRDHPLLEEPPQLKKKNSEPSLSPKPNLFFKFCRACAFAAISKSHAQSRISKVYIYYFFSKSFMVSVFVLRYFIQFS